MPYLTFDRKTILVVDSQRRASHEFTIENMSSSDWGFIYERYVGLRYESLGWSVDYRGLELQLLDQGIDLIIAKASRKKYIQCKYSHGVRRLGKQRIEMILYQASTRLAEEYQGKKLSFVLVVPSIEKAMTDWAKNYFLSKNSTQDKVDLELKEVSMELPIYRPEVRTHTR